MASSNIERKNVIDVVKYRWVWITFSLFLIIPSIAVMIFSMFKYETHSPMRLGIDFTGGTLLQYGFKQELKKEDITKIREALSSVGVENAIIQLQESDDFLKNTSVTDEQGILAGQKETDKKTKIESTEKIEEKTAEIEKTPEIDSIKSVVSMRTKFLNKEGTARVNSALKDNFGEFVPLQVSAIGPTLGKELFKNAIIALLLAFVGIVGYLTVRFNIDYAVFALVALFHDAIFVCGVFSLLGLVFGTEIDSLFITAILTVIGFSVHDTIVVFDRVRENTKFHAKKKSFNEIVNLSVNQTLARSINTSITTLLTLLALYFLGGVTTKDFVLAMILGIIIGTYSSIFNASVLLAWWREKSPTAKAA